MRHLLDTADLTHAQAVHILDTAAAMASTQERQIRKLPTLRGKTVVNLFYEDSTRTRISFEAAAKRLSADVINFSAKGSSVAKGESLKDTAQTLAAIGADAVVIRHPASGAPELLAHRGWIDVPVINAGDGTHAHPTQALLDAYTIRAALAGGTGDLSGLQVVIVGDILHSRVARSNIHLLALLGASVHLVAPATLLPVAIDDWPVNVWYDFDQAIAEVQPDACMMLRVQAERMTAQAGGFFPSTQEYSRMYGLDARRLESLGPDAVILHPGPMNRGLEISAAAADSPQTLVLNQVASGVSVRMAALYLLLAGHSEPAPTTASERTLPV